MSESEPSRLQMGMGGSLPPLSLPPLSLPPIKTDPLGLSPLSYNSAINQAMHSPISTNVASPSNHVNSPQQQMFPQPPSSPLAYGNGSPRQMPMKRRFPVGQEPGVFQQRQGMESLPKQMKSLSAPSGSMPPSPMRYQEPIASPSSSYAQSPSNVPSPSTSHHLPNGNGPVHPQMHPQALKVSQASVQPMQMAHQQQPHHPMPQQIPQQGQQMPQQGVNMAEFRGTPNGTFHPSVSSAPSPNLYHKPRPVEANAQVSQQLQHLQMRPSTSHQQSMVQQAHHMQNMQNAQMQVPQMFPSQQHHMFPSQGMPGQPPVGFVQVQQGPPQQQRMAMQHPQAVHIVQQRMIPGQGVVPVVVAQPQQQQLQQQQIQQQQQQQQLQAQMSQQQIKHLLANRVNGPPPVNGPNGPGPSSTPALQQSSVFEVLTRLHPGRLGQLPPSQANMPVRTILSAQQHQMANGRPGIPVSMPMQMHPSGQPMMHQVMAAPRSNPTAAMQLARMIDERMGPPTSSKEQYRAFKKKFKYLVYENECYQEELRNLQRKLLKLSRDKNFLLDRLMQFEKVSDSSDDDSDSSQKMVDDRPKTKKRVRTQKRKSSPHTDGVGSVSGTPSPCPSPAPTNNLLQVMLQQSTSSAVFSPSGEPKQPPNREEQLRMAEDRRQALLQLQNPGEREMRQPFPREPMGDPVVNGYPAGPHFPSQSSSAPAQSLSHLNGHLPSTPSAASEEIDQKPVP